MTPLVRESTAFLMGGHLMESQHSSGLERQPTQESDQSGEMSPGV